MRTFLLLSLMLLAGIIPVAAQGQTIVKEDLRVSAGTTKWWKGAMTNLTPPDMFSSSAENDAWRSRGMTGFRSVEGYFYQAVLTNHNGQKIKGIIWEYLFFDPVTKAQLGRHKIFSKVSIKGNDAETVLAFKTKPPSQTVSAAALGEKERKNQYLERIEVKAVLFDNGTLWKSANISERDCNRLRLIVKRGRIFR